MKRCALFKKIQSVMIHSLALVYLSACSTTPLHLDDQSQDHNKRFIRKADLSLEYLQVFNELAQTAISPNSIKQTVFLSKGDILRIRFQGMAENDGLYQINTNGQLELPFSSGMTARGHTRSSLIQLLENELVKQKWFYTDTVKVDVSLVRMAPVSVAVYGAVFNPGRVSINNQPIDKPEDAIQQLSGVHSTGRDLVDALTAVGGIRPDANLEQVYLKRGNQISKISLKHIINGTQFVSTPSLLDGDVVFVQSTGSEDRSLIKPSQVTPPGMRVFMSNLTAPALSNAQSAVGADSTRLPYGSSLLDSAISANCVGGTHQANASRSIILVTRNHGSNEQLVIKRSVNQLLANSSEIQVNPYIMPNDAIACYDSRFTNFRDVARGVVEIISPLLLGRVL